MQNLKSLIIEIDFSKRLLIENPEKQSRADLFDKIDLGMLKATHFKGIQLALESLGEFIPNIEFSKNIGKNKVKIALYQYKKLELEILREDGVITIGDKKPEEKTLNSEELMTIGKDFNYIVGVIIGLSKNNEKTAIEVKLTFEKDGRFVSEEKIRSLNAIVSEMLQNPKTLITGLNIEMNDSLNQRHQIVIAQKKETFRFKDSFETTSDGPIDINKIYENSLNLSNEICGKVCCE